MKLTRHIIFLLTLIISITAISCNDSSNSIRVENWKILHDQDDSLKAVSRKDGWKPIKIPSSFKFTYSPVNAFQFVWLKGEFDIQGDPSVYSGLSTGRILLSDKTYINTHLVGNTPPGYVSHTPFPRNYIIPKGILKKGRNEVFIQLGAYHKYYGGILNHVLIQPEKEFSSTRFLRNVVYILIPFGVVFLFAGIVAVLLIAFLWNRKEEIVLYSLLALFLLIILIVSQNIPYNIASFDLLSSICWSMVPLFSVLLILIIQSMYRIYFSNYNRIIIPLLSVLALAVLIISNTTYNMQIGYITAILTLIISIPFFFFMIIRLNSIKPDKLLFYMVSIISLIAGFIAIFEVYNVYIGGRYLALAYTFISPVFIIIFAIVLSREHMNRLVEIELLYDKLKRFEGQGKEISITDTSEEKLKRVIEFIDDNYTFDISREGLAAAVGINPNYMGSLFKTYTGQTINEYINQLRIEEAANQIESNDSRIIDIALSVGFESLATFNRVFKKATGKTPSDYRGN